MSGATAMSPLGLAIAGPVADALGVQFWFLTAGIVTAAVGLAAFFVPAIMRIEDGSPEKVRTGDGDPTASADELATVPTSASQ